MFDYSLIRIVPRVHLGDCETVGAILQCRQRRFIGVRWSEPPEQLAARWPHLGEMTARALLAIEATASGQGPIGRFPPAERFHWLTAPRSSVVQPSPIHTGIGDDPHEALDRVVSAIMR
ncbi:MAG: DUF3037 domain-containing protein [Bacteroidota bacterium]